MRILHTSDWHLGRTFNGASLHDEQAAALDRIVEINSASQIDLVIIAGDLYDRGYPPTEAVQLFDSTVARLRSTGATVVAISGNHDSGARVGVYDKMLAGTGVSIRGDISRSNEAILVEPRDQTAPVAIYPIPFLEPSAALNALRSDVDVDCAQDGEPSCNAVVRRRLSQDQLAKLAAERIRADLATRGLRSVVIAHTFMDGGSACESERELTVGNVEKVGTDAFAGFDYVALGHLHGRQVFEGGRIAYSGTPLPYSFSEESHVKSVSIAEMSSDGSVKTDLIDLNVGRKLHTIVGTLDDLLRSSEFAYAEQGRVRAVLLDKHMPLQAMTQLQKRFPHAVSLQREKDKAVQEREFVPTADPSRSPQEFVFDFWRDQVGLEPDSRESALLVEAVAENQRLTAQ